MHFTPATGWNNDPHGIVFVDGRYHLFFQYNPAGTVWSEACHWGHATSQDLVVWTEQDVALSPEPGEIGCWSGSVVFDGDTPTILYTRIVGDWGSGQVALARGSASLDTWRQEPRASVVSGPPPGLDVIAFRDPFVWREDTAWRMVIGAGTRSGHAAIVQYSSPDLVDWRYDGVLAQRHTSETEPVWTGKLWECPQLFQVDGTWVLLVSVWNDNVLHHVCYAFGDYDGSFVPRTWGRFSHGDQLYATSTFVDADGRRCVTSWLREHDKEPRESDFAGALTVPHVLHVEGDRLTARHHPNLARHITERSTTPLDGREVDAGRVDAAFLIETDYDPSPGAAICFAFTDSAGHLLEITLDHRAAQLTVATTGVQIMQIELEETTAAGRLALLVDADILEVVTSGTSGVGAARIPYLSGCRLVVRTADRFRARAVSVSRLAR